MASINDCKRLLEFRANKSGYNGYLSPDNFNLIWQRAETRYFNKKYKRYGLNQDNNEALSVFKTAPIPITVDTNGKYTKPLDILHIDSIRHALSGEEVEVTRVEDDRLASNLSSEYDAPTAEFPIYVEYNTYLQFYPKSLATAILVYLQKPEPSLWAYTINGQNKPVYNSAASVQPKWDDTEIDEIIYLAGEDLGLNMRDNELMGFNNMKLKQEG